MVKPFFHRSRLPVMFVFLLAVALRVSLALVNWEANDDHMQVIRIIRATGQLPLKAADCNECFQPKLFHATAAAMLDAAAIPTGILEIKAVQLLNAVLGCAILWFAWRFMTGLAFSERATFFGFALLALNPKLIGINAQATNDTFVIFFGVLAVYYAGEFFRFRRNRDFVCLIAASMLGILSKTNGVITFGSIVLAMAIAVLGRRVRGVHDAGARYAIAFTILVPVLVAINPVGQFVENWRRYGTPVTLNMEPQSRPRFFEHTTCWWPGVRSISEAFFTFRLVNLVAQPYITYPPAPYPLHRTSLWSQIYGHAHFVHFDAWPRSWATSQTTILNLGRTILLVALIPTALLLAGAVLESRRLWITFINGTATLPSSVLTICFFGFLAFAAAYSYRYRAFTVMKAIFMYPALLTFAYHFAVALDWIAELPFRLSGRLVAVISGALVTLLVLYVFDVAALIIQLWCCR